MNDYYLYPKISHDWTKNPRTFIIILKYFLKNWKKIQSLHVSNRLKISK